VRTDPDPDSSELATLGQYLDYQRETILAKADGLAAGPLARTALASGLTLGGLLHHLALVEETWMEVRFAGQSVREPWVGVDWDADPDWELRTAAAVEPDGLRRRYRDACDRSRHVAARATGPGQLSVQPLRDGRVGE